MERTAQERQERFVRFKDRLSFLTDEKFAELDRALTGRTVEAIGPVCNAEFERNLPLIGEPAPVTEESQSPLHARRWLLVGAGPSALLHRDELMKKSEDVAIIACDRVAFGYETKKGRVRGLLEDGVPVDVVVGIDPVTGRNDPITGRMAAACPPREKLKVFPEVWLDTQYCHEGVKAIQAAGLRIRWFQGYDSEEAVLSRCSRLPRPNSRSSVRDSREAAFIFAARALMNFDFLSLLKAEHAWNGARNGGTRVRDLPALCQYTSSTMAMYVIADALCPGEIGFLGYDLCEPRLSMTDAQHAALTAYWNAFEPCAAKGRIDEEEDAPRLNAAYNAVVATGLDPQAIDYLGWHVGVVENTRGVSWTLPKSAKDLPAKPLGVMFFLRTGARTLAPSRVDMFLQREGLARLISYAAVLREERGAGRSFVQCAPEGTLGFDSKGELVEEVFRVERPSEFLMRKAA